MQLDLFALNIFFGSHQADKSKYDHLRNKKKYAKHLISVIQITFLAL